ncbi:hypothetical protein C8R47DRAFT_566132 [Mycena vitilis]|nr:hypothetical protein C8R47DRAFT_566132 [Mycena vitilis]
MWSSTLLSAALLLSGISLASVIPVEQVCEGQVTAAEKYIGQDKNVLVQQATCPTFGSNLKVKTLESRQLDVCGNTCEERAAKRIAAVTSYPIGTTNCFTPSGGGPNTTDCHVIADALRFNSQNTGPLFTIGTGINNTVVVKYSTCLSFFVNQDASPLEYCDTEWAKLIDFVGPNCAAAQNAHGGLCVATNQQWFVQVAHS